MWNSKFYTMKYEIIWHNYDSIPYIHVFSIIPVINCCVDHDITLIEKGINTLYGKFRDDKNIWMPYLISYLGMILCEIVE